MAQITKELQFIEDYIDAFKLEDLSKVTAEEALNDVRAQIQEIKENNTAVILTETKSVKTYRCPACGQDYKLYRKFFTTMHVELLKKVFNHCVKNRTHEILKKDLPDLSRTEYGDFCTLQRFGMIYFLKDENGKRIKGGAWGVPVKRVAKFLRWEGQVSKFYLRNTATKENTPSEEKITIREVKKIDKIIDEITNLPTYMEYEDWQNSL